MEQLQNPVKPSESFGTKLTKFLIGAPVVTIVGYLFAGDSFFTLVFVSVICTAGVALGIWIPLCYGVGSLVYRMIKKSDGMPASMTPPREERAVATALSGSQISPALSSSTVAPSQPATYTANQIAIIRYIQDGRQAGMADVMMRQELANVGWPNQDIEAAFGYFQP